MIRLVYFSILFLLLLNFAKLNAQNLTTGRIETEILLPIAVLETEPLNFGKIINSGGGGIVAINPLGQRMNSGDVAVVSNETYSAARFAVTNSQGKVISITLPVDAQKVYSETSSQPLLVSDFESNLPESGILISESNGVTIVTVGAKLNIGNWDSAPAGKYSGTYEIAFTYN